MSMVCSGPLIEEGSAGADNDPRSQQQLWNGALTKLESMVFGSHR